MKMRASKYIFPIAVMFALVSCEKELDFEYHDIPAQQVIEGLLTQEGASVRLTMTVATDEPFSDLTVTDASVTIADLTADEVFTLAAGADGIFTSDDVSGRTGHEYELTVQIGENKYTSVSRMLAPSEIVSAEFSWIKMPYDDVAILKVQFTEDTDPAANYWMRVYRNGEIYDWQAITSHNAVDGIVTGMMMTTRKDVDEEDDDDVLRDGDVVDIEVMTISEEMADYLESLNNGDYNGNMMFTGAYCLGYFLAAPVSKAQIIFHPAEIPYAE